MDIPLGPHEIALLAAVVGPDLQKQADHAARLLRKALNRQPDKDLLREFEDFWSAYPRKVAVGAARSSYVRARGKVDQGTILRGLAAFCVDCRGKEAKFIPHASTWLNQERWSDRQDEQINGSKTGQVSEKSNGSSDRADPNYGYRSQVQHFLAKGKWCFRGTPPTDPTCLIPREVLREFAGQFAAKGLVIPVLR